MHDTTKTDFRQTFNTDHGKRCLANILIEGNFFGYVDTQQDMAVQNFVRDILTKAECFPFFEKGCQNKGVNEIVDLMFNLKVQDNVKSKEDSEEDVKGYGESDGEETAYDID